MDHNNIWHMPLLYVQNRYDWIVGIHGMEFSYIWNWDNVNS